MFIQFNYCSYFAVSRDELSTSYVKKGKYTYRAPGSRQYNENGSAYAPKEFDVLGI